MALMTWLLGGKVRSVKITDPAYYDFDITRIAVAQAVVDEILQGIDVAAFTKVVHKGVDALTPEQLRAVEAGDAIMELLIERWARSVDEYNYLKTIVGQYFFADEMWRLQVQRDWVKVCLTYSSSNPVRPFPMAAGVFAWIVS